MVLFHQLLNWIFSDEATLLPRNSPKNPKAQQPTKVIYFLELHNL